METAGKSSLPGAFQSLEVLASHHSQCIFTHSPVPWFGAVNDSCPYLSLSSGSGEVEGSSCSSSFPAVIPLMLKKYSQFYFDATMLVPFPHVLEDSVYLVKLLQNVLSFRKRG